jgi:hypothetical protein
MRIRIKRIFYISRGEHLQEVLISTFLPQKDEPLIPYSYRITESSPPHRGNGQLIKSREN